MAAAKPAFGLIDFYVKEYEKKYGVRPAMNRFKRQWHFAAMIDDYGFEEAKNIIQYFFTTCRRAPKIEDLLYNYEDLKEMRDAEILDIEHRKKVREQTRRMVEEWEQTHGE